MRVALLLFAPIVALIGCSALHNDPDSEETGEKGYSTDIDYTDETRWWMSLADVEPHRLRTFLPDRVVFYAFGEYRQPLASTGGNSLYLFPSFEYSITSWCDVCGEDDVLELGTWSFDDGLIRLIPTRSAPEHLALYDLDFFYRSIGDFRSLRLFVTGDDVIEDSVLVSVEKLEAVDEGEVRGLLRTEAYPDWPAKLQRFKASIH